MHELLHEIRTEWAPSDIQDAATWADVHRILTKTTSAEPGPWKTSRAPYTRFPMEVFSFPSIRTIVLKWGTQLGKTEVQLNLIGFVLDTLGGSILSVYPTDRVLEKVFRTRISGMVEACSTLRAKKHPNPDRFQTTEMHYTDGIHYLATANSAADLKSMPIEFLFADEVAVFPQFAGKDADPIKLAQERQKSFPLTRKAVLVSSPTVENGPISRYYDSCDLHYRYHTPCPYCGEMQPLEFGGKDTDHGIKWPDLGDTADRSVMLQIKRAAQYICRGCHQGISDRDKPRMLADGKWIAQEEAFEGDPESVAFHLNSLYSPFLTWGDVAYEFLDSQGDIGRLMNFTNGWLAEEWVQTVHTRESSQVLEHRTELEPLSVPKEAVALTMGIDSQKFGFYFVIRAWARDYTSWLIRYGHVEAWDDLERIVFQDTYPVAGSNNLRMAPWRIFIDTGGGEGADGVSMTEEVYTWLRGPGRGVQGVKGASWKTGKRMSLTVIDRMPGRQGLPIPGGLRVWLIDTDVFKDALFYRLGIAKEQPGAWYVHSETGEDYAQQLAAEEKRRDRKGKTSWVQKGPHNHYLDAEVYACAAADPACHGGVKVLGKPVYAQASAASHERVKRPPDSKRNWFNPRGRTGGWLER